MVNVSAGKQSSKFKKEDLNGFENIDISYEDVSLKSLSDFILVLFCYR